ncbi:hypothetical protein LCGC14_1283970, partial [marine sediment metagenome]
MAIEKAAATSNFTLNATSDTLVNGMTLTPAAGDYLLYFTVENFTTTSAVAGKENIFSVYVGGTIVPHTVRTAQENSSGDDTYTVMCVSCKVSPNGSQAVEIRYHATSSSNPSIAHEREMDLFPIPATGTDYEQSATGSDTTNSGTYATLGSMSVTPVAGDYLLTFTTSGGAPDNAEMAFKVTVGGTEVAHTLRSFFYESSFSADEAVFSIACK